MKRGFVLPAVGAAVVAVLLAAASAVGSPGKLAKPGATSSPPVSGAVEVADDLGHFITECPQAGLRGNRPQPLDRRQIDEVEKLSNKGDDIRTNQDYSCFPQNETSVAFNPRNLENLLTTQNDYRTLSRQGFGATSDGGRSFYDGELPPPSVPNGDILDASGDPVSVYDRDGIAYSSAINFNRTDDENGITVQRSTNGGFTWTRPCVPIPGSGSDPDEGARCGAIGDPRQPGDGVVTYFDDPDNELNGSQPFDDKEWLAAGPRPAGVDPVCFTPVEREPRACDPEVVGIDRLYVTWTRFEDNPAALFGFTANILLSYSDDQGRSWSPPRVISGSAPFCGFSVPAESCDLNQFSVPTVHQKTGLLGVAFENFNTPDENQYLFVRSEDGGNTFEGPFFITPIFDVNYPRAGAAGGRPDCTMRGQQNGRPVLTNSCFRVNSGGNVVVDKRDGEFADDFYLVMSDNRNGTPASSNVDVFFFRSTDGGMTWVGPTRVNTDRSEPPADRDDPDAEGNFGNDQWFPWMDINGTGVVAVGFHDRRLDTESVEHEWPGSRERPGNYLAWFWGAGCEITTTAKVSEGDSGIPSRARQCLAPGAAIIPQPTEPPDAPSGAVPGQGPTFLGPFKNQAVSDVPHNLDYSFRAGIFMGDYNAVAYPNVPAGEEGGKDKGKDKKKDKGRKGDGEAAAFWTDSRNGRGSGNPTNPDTFQPGRNPACEQADVFLDFFDPLKENDGEKAAEGLELFLVTPCPKEALDKRDKHTKKKDK